MIIFGAVDFTAALARTAKLLGYHVTVCDARAVFATRARFPMADEVVCDWPDRYLRGQASELTARDAVCVLTHDPKFDVPAIVAALATNVGYIGAMGSRRTHAERVARLREAGVDDAGLARVHAPIGLDLGARTPEETAIAICAEIIAQRTGRAAPSLRDARRADPRVSARHAPPHARLEWTSGSPVAAPRSRRARRGSGGRARWRSPPRGPRSRSAVATPRPSRPPPTERGLVPIVADVSTPEGAAGFVRDARGALGGVDILVPNAGGPPPGEFADVTDLERVRPGVRAERPVDDRHVLRGGPRDAGPALGSGRRDHVDRGAPADPDADPVEHRPGRRDRVPEDARPRGRGRRGDRQLAAARPPRHGPHPRAHGRPRTPPPRGSPPG